MLRTPNQINEYYCKSCFFLWRTMSPYKYCPKCDTDNVDTLKGNYFQRCKERAEIELKAKANNV